MANITYDEVFVSSGSSIIGYYYVPDPFSVPGDPPNGEYIAWEPLPYFVEENSTPSYAYSSVQLWRETGRLYFGKVVTNTGTSDGSFVFLWSALP